MSAATQVFSSWSTNVLVVSGSAVWSEFGVWSEVAIVRMVSDCVLSVVDVGCVSSTSSVL